MKYKVAELEGAQLDAAVAKAEGKQWESQIYGPDRDDWYVSVDGARFAPSQEWDQGGPIIDREHIATEFHQGDGIWTGAVRSRRVSWEDWEDDGWGEGPTPLIAAMRAYVASKFGEEVDLT